MTDIKINVSSDAVAGLFDSRDGLAKLVEDVLNQILDAQATEALGAERYERTDERQGLRNGYRTRTLSTRVGPLTLRVPQTRDGSFSTELFSRYQRSEQAFVLALMEMVVQGVSTRKVTTITEELCGVSFSKSLVSSLSANLEPRVRAFNERRLDGAYAFLVVDAMFFKSRDCDRVIQRAALIISGIRDDGHREILGVRIGNTESYVTWDETFAWLKGRGLKDIAYVISDEHAGLTHAIQRHFQGATWQRCQVHLMRNILGHTSVRHRADVAEAVKNIFAASSLAEARRQLEEFEDNFSKKASKAVACLADGFEDAMAVMALPAKYRKRLRTTNMMERLNREIRRRERVIGIFPNDESALRLMGALLAEFNEKWQQRRYLDMDEYRDWVAARGELHRSVASVTAVV